MADPRFFDNRGPFTLSEVCGRIGADIPAGAGANAKIEDLASLEGAGPSHLSFCVGKAVQKALAQSSAGYCLMPPAMAALPGLPPGLLAIPAASPNHAFATVARMFYPQGDLAAWSQQTAVDPSARIAADVSLAPGVVIGPGAEIGEGTRLGPNAVIGRGVAIGRNCEIGSNVAITHAYVGDNVLILPGAQIGSPGFGFASSGRGHEKIPQLGRVIVQDKVEIGAGSTIDRGALTDTVIGEGTKIDNLVQIGHGTRIGRHCIVVAQAGIAGSCELGDFVVLGGQSAAADHARIGDGARLAARGAFAPGEHKGGLDYGGSPAKLMRDWARELAAVSMLAKRRKRD